MVKTIGQVDFPRRLAELIQQADGNYQICMRVGGEQSDYNIVFARLDPQGGVVDSAYFRVCVDGRGGARSNSYLLTQHIVRAVYGLPAGEKEFPDEQQGDTWNAGIATGCGYVYLTCKAGEISVTRDIVH